MSHIIIRAYLILYQVYKNGAIMNNRILELELQDLILVVPIKLKFHKTHVD